MRNILCTVLGHSISRTLVIYNQIKLPSEPEKQLICTRCNKDLIFNNLNHDKMINHQELEMWYALYWKMRGIPKENRSQNYTAFCNEITTKIYDLVNDLGFDQEQWSTEE